MPVWVAVAIGLGSGLAGTLVRIAYERTADLRTRMIDAADEFSTGTSRAIAAIDDFHRALDRVPVNELSKIDLAFPQQFEGELPEPLDAAWLVLRDATDAVAERLARVHLLFGTPQTSPAGSVADTLVVNLRFVRGFLRVHPTIVTQSENRSVYDAAADAVRTLHQDFNLWARKELRGGALWSLRQRSLVVRHRVWRSRNAQKGIQTLERL